AEELKGSLLVLTTSSPDKRDIYRLLFSSHNKTDHQAGLNLFYSDSGALGIAPRKTPEQTGHYEGNLSEKAAQQIARLQDEQTRQKIRLQLMAGGKQEFDPTRINIMGMTEDSGWKLIFDNPDQEKAFVEHIKQKLETKIRDKDRWLSDKLH